MSSFRRLSASVVLGALFAVAAWVSPAAAAIGSGWDTVYRGVNVHLCNAEQWLNAGGVWYFGNAKLTMQTDGNLVIYDNRTGKPKWATGTNGKSGNIMEFRSEPRTNPLIVRDTRSGQVWWGVPITANCVDEGSSFVLALQGDSNFVLYCVRQGVIGKSVWASGTVF